MREVPIVLFKSMRRAFERYGIRTGGCLEGLSLAKVPAWAIAGRVDWDELAIFLERCAEGLGPDEQERIGELYPFENHFLQFIVRNTVSPRLLHRIVWESTKPAFPHMRVSIEELTDHHVVTHIELPRSYRGSPFFFRGTVGEFRTMTELLGLGPSQVEADVGPWHGRYVARFPEALPEEDLGVASRRLLADRQWALPTLVGWLFGHERDAHAEDVLDRLQRVRGLSAVEATAVVRLGTGVSVPEIAHELGLGVAALEELLRTERERLSDAVRAELVAQAVGRF
jgi:hypothetical protein